MRFLNALTVNLSAEDAPGHTVKTSSRNRRRGRRRIGEEPEFVLRTVRAWQGNRQRTFTWHRREAPTELRVHNPCLLLSSWSKHFWMRILEGLRQHLLRTLLISLPISVARSMLNFGLHDLRLVSPECDYQTAKAKARAGNRVTQSNPI